MSAALRIGRLHTDLLVPEGRLDPQGLAGDLSAHLERHLESALAEALSRRLGTDQEVHLIPRLAITLEIGAHWDGDQLARTFARAIAQALEPLLSGSRGQVIRFPDRGAYLGRFLLDLATGQAWDRWYYRRFRGLAMLPVSAALRSALCAPDAPALAALTGLREMERDQILGALGEPDTLRVLDALSDTGIGREPAAEPAAVLEALRRVGPPSDRETEPLTRDALRTLLRVAERSPELVGPILTELALALGVLTRTLARVQDRDLLMDALARRNLSALFQSLGAETAQTLQPLLACPPESLQALVSDLLGMAPRPAEGPNPESQDQAGRRQEGLSPRHTRLGGLLMLLPILADWPLQQALNGLQPLGEVPAPALVRFLILTLCAGAPRADTALNDPVLRTLSAIPADLTRGDIRDWLEEASAAGLAECLRGLASRRTHENSGPLVLSQDGGTWVLMLGRHGTWIRAWEGEPSNDMEHWLLRQGTLLVPDDSKSELGAIARGLKADAARTKSPRHGTPEITGYRQAPTSDPKLAATLARLDQLGDDLAFVIPGPTLSRDRDTALTLALTTQGLLRDLARRLPGFAHSGLAYLYRNFLDLEASLEVTDDRYLVRLSRPPINVIVAMTGLARGIHRLDWLDRPLQLYQGD